MFPTALMMCCRSPYVRVSTGKFVSRYLFFLTGLGYGVEHHRCMERRNDPTAPLPKHPGRQMAEPVKDSVRTKLNIILPSIPRSFCPGTPFQMSKDSAGTFRRTFHRTFHRRLACIVPNRRPSSQASIRGAHMCVHSWACACDRSKYWHGCSS